MQIGSFKDYLNHLSTKFIARRSDIIVSSTLSVTLAPEDDGFEPSKFALLNEKEIWMYVVLRQEYRAYQIKSNTLPKNDRYYSRHSKYNADVSTPLTSFAGIKEEDSECDSYFEENQNVDMSQFQRHSNKGKEKLPPTLLSEPLDLRIRESLSKKELRLYKLQTSKYDQQIKINLKKKVHPRD